MPIAKRFPRVGSWAPVAIPTIWWIVNALAPFDQKRLDVIEIAAGVGAALGVAWVFANARKDRAAKRATSRDMAYLLAMVLTIAMLGSTARHDERAYGNIALAMAECAAVWALLMGAQRSGDGTLARFYTLLAAFVGLAAWSAVFSFDPARSIEDFSTGVGLQVPFAMALGLFATDRLPEKSFFRPLATFGGIAALGTVVIFAIATFGPLETRIGFEDREWIRWDSPDPIAEKTWRVTFPFTHHNRLASYSLLVFFAAPATGAIYSRAGKRIAAFFLVASALAAAAILLSKTRGAYLALAAGLVAMSLLLSGSRRLMSLGILGVIAAGILILPGPRRQFASILEPNTYTEGTSTVALRASAWKAAADMIVRRPLLGFGYGEETFERVYRSDYREKLGDPEVKPHAHNNFLEIGVEMGIPALVVVLWLNGMLAIALWRRCRDTRDDPASPWPAMFGMFVAIHVYGMSNLNLRYGAAYLIWPFFVFVAAQATRTDRPGATIAPEP